MTFEDLTIYLVGWIVIGFIIYMIIAVDADFETLDYLKHLSRNKRILCKLGLFFLWPIWLPLFILLEMVLLIINVVWSILNRKSMTNKEDWMICPNCKGKGKVFGTEVPPENKTVAVIELFDK